MTNIEILEKAFKKATDNGWEPLGDNIPISVTRWKGQGSIEIGLLNDKPGAWGSWVRELEGIIYNHDFAKALWGESHQFTPKEVMDSGAKGSLKWGMRTIGWKDHLKDMVVADDPIKYLGEHL